MMFRLYENQEYLYFMFHMDYKHFFNNKYILTCAVSFVPGKIVIYGWECCPGIHAMYQPNMEIYPVGLLVPAPIQLE